MPPAVWLDVTLWPVDDSCMEQSIVADSDLVAARGKSDRRLMDPTYNHGTPELYPNWD